MRCERARAHKGTLRLLPCLIVHKCTTPTRCEYVRCTLRAVFATSRTHPRYVTKSQSLAEPAGGASSALGARALKGRLAESPTCHPLSAPIVQPAKRRQRQSEGESETSSATTSGLSSRLTHTGHLGAQVAGSGPKGLGETAKKVV